MASHCCKLKTGEREREIRNGVESYICDGFNFKRTVSSRSMYGDCGIGGLG